MMEQEYPDSLPSVFDGGIKPEALEGVQMFVDDEYLFMRITYLLDGRTELVNWMRAVFDEACFPVDGYWSMHLDDVDQFAAAIHGRFSEFADAIVRMKNAV